MGRAVSSKSPATARRGLTRDAIVEAAIRIADTDGVAAVSMRHVARELGVDPMSLYRHVGGKDDLLDAMTDAVIAAISPAGEADDWVTAARDTMLAARHAMLAHPWAAAVLGTRNEPTPSALRHIDAMLGILRRGGCSVALAHHALHVLGSRILGFSQDLFDDGATAAASPATIAAQAEAWALTMPHVAELALAADHDGGLGGCDDDEEFRFAIDLLLDGLDRRRTTRTNS